MACLSNYTLKGIATDCSVNLAGIEEVYLGYWGDFNVVENEATHSISSITASNSAKFHLYEFSRGTGSMTSTLTTNDENGVAYYTTVISLQFAKMDGAKHIEIEAMAKERLVGIVKDNNGKYHFVGVGGYLRGSENVAQSGQALDDLNGYTISLSQTSGHLPYFIDYSKFSSLIDGGSVQAQ